MDTLDVVTQSVRVWIIYGGAFREERAAKLLSGRLLVYFNGTRVVRFADRYYVLVWRREQTSGTETDEGGNCEVIE